MVALVAPALLTGTGRVNTLSQIPLPRCYVSFPPGPKSPSDQPSMVRHNALECCGCRGRPKLPAKSRCTRKIVPRLLVPALHLHSSAWLRSAGRPGFGPGILYPASGEELSRSGGSSERPVSVISVGRPQALYFG